MRTDRRNSVLHVFNYFKPDFTGEGIYVTNMMPLLDRHGIRSDILVKRTSPEKKGTRAQRESEPVEHTIHFLDSRRSRIFPSELQLFWWILRFARRYGVIHYHAFCDRYFLSMLIARLYGCKVVLSCTLDDGPGEVLKTYHPFYRGLVRRLYALIHAFVTISPKLHDDAKGVVPDRKNHLIPQGVLPPVEPRPGREEMRAAKGLGEDDVALLFIGAICARKNPHFLVEQMSLIRERHPHVRLFVVGPDLEDEYAEKTRRIARERGLESCVHFEGFTDNPASYYAMADIMVFSSTNEGFGNVLLEGMAHGLPLVVRRLPGVTDYFIEHGETGFLFEDESEYRASLERLIEDHGLRRSIGAAASAAVFAKFSLEEIAEQYVNLYRE